MFDTDLVETYPNPQGSYSVTIEDSFPSVLPFVCYRSSIMRYHETLADRLQARDTAEKHHPQDHWIGLRENLNRKP